MRVGAEAIGRGAEDGASWSSREPGLWPTIGHPTLGPLMQAMGSARVGLCLCDENDLIRFVNDTFRLAFFPRFDGCPADFTETLAAAIVAGEGLKLQSMPVEDFVDTIKARRRRPVPYTDFRADCRDGGWWWINDHRLASGWTLAIATNMSDARRRETQLEHAHAAALAASRTDELTGLANRRYGIEQAEAALREAAMLSEPLSLALVDLDHFKRVNDQHGHGVGDRMLSHFAHALRAALGPDNPVSRIGGEEFMVVLPGRAAPEARSLLGAVLARLPVLVLGPDRGVLVPQASAGVAAAARGAGFAELFADADEALYAAKALGRGRVELALVVPGGGGRQRRAGRQEGWSAP